MHLLLCNDDGYKAKGIQVLSEQLHAIGHKITIIAPNGERSALSHAMTFYQPIRVRQVSERIYAVDGTPADCVAVGLSKILTDDPPDFVISGINHGLNVGIDVNYSGTVGAATEAALMGFKAIAVSADTEHLNELALNKIFLQSSQIVSQILEKSNNFDWPKLEILNVNIPCNAKNISLAECSGESLYVPHIEEMSPSQKKDMKIYLIGGISRFSPQDMSQDVSLIANNNITLSFVRAKQSSTISNSNLIKLIGNLNL